MATRAEISAIYAGGVVEGVTLVTFPAVASIFTSADHYALTDTEYGGMFIPQAITAITASLLGAGLGRKLGGKYVLLIGLAADLFSMILLFLSQFANGTTAYDALLAATAFLGVGFGFAVPALNTFTAAFFPEKVDRAILTLNALLGLGTALAPIFATIFVGLKIWWGLPLLMALLTTLLILFILRLPLQDAAVTSPAQKVKIPTRFWLYAGFALLYGIGETMNGNWATVFMTNQFKASTTLASMALTAFWATVTAGRILFASIEKWVPEQWVFRLLPVLLALAFVITVSISASQPIAAMLSFGLAGLACSALLPLVISFGQSELKTMSAAVASGLIGFYQMGYGIAAFGVGPLQSGWGFNLVEIYRGAVIIAVALAVVAFMITAKRRA